MKKYMIFIGILFAITIVSLIVFFSTGILKQHKIVTFTYNYWADYGENSSQEYYYRNQMYYVEKDNLYRIFRVLNSNEDSIIKTIDKSYFDKLEKIVNDNNLKEWNGFDKESSGDYRKCFFIEIEYDDGEKVFARGIGELPENYEKVSSELIELFLSTK